MEDPLLLLHHNNATVIDRLELGKAPSGAITRYWLYVVSDGMGMPVYIPVIVAKGLKEGPTLGLTAVVHGNELNGIPVIQQLFNQIDIAALEGTIVGVPVVNYPAMLRMERPFIDGVDLNQIMPGKANGNVSQVYAHRLVHSVICEFDYLIDLHTASFGRTNSYYIRVDMDHPVTRSMALLQNAQIIVHNHPAPGTLRAAAEALGIHAITLEVGNPNTFQKGMIRSSLTGIHNLLSHLGMIKNKIEPAAQEPVICKSSYWIYTDQGGIIHVRPELAAMVKKGEVIATLRNIFGDLIKEYPAPEDGVVIGKSVNPVNQTGGRILHLGIPG